MSQAIFKEVKSIIIECPKCNQKLRIPNDKGNIKVKCVCGEEFLESFAFADNKYSPDKLYEAFFNIREYAIKRSSKLINKSTIKAINVDLGKFEEEINLLGINLKYIQLGTYFDSLEKTIKELYQKHVNSIKRKLESKYSIFIMGMGKYGKSTLINALLGQAIASVDSLPKTWKVDRYDDSIKKDKVEIIHTNGESTFHSFLEAKKILEDEENKIIRFEINLANKIREAIKSASSIEEREDIQIRYHKLRKFRKASRRKGHGRSRLVE